jgi:hypothetical protein
LSATFVMRCSACARAAFALPADRVAIRAGEPTHVLVEIDFELPTGWEAAVPTAPDGPFRCPQCAAGAAEAS